MVNDTTTKKLLKHGEAFISCILAEVMKTFSYNTKVEVEMKIAAAACNEKVSIENFLPNTIMEYNKNE